jgi:glycosyltransferase involved in cell wall biosynthesis
MKVCLINNLFGFYAKGGAEEVIKTIALGFLERGDEVLIITTKPWFEKRKEVRSDFKIYFINSFYHYLNRWPSGLRLFWHIWDCFDFITARRIRKVLQAEKIDLVITNNIVGLSRLSLQQGNDKIKQVHILHDIQLLYPSGLMLYGKEKMLNSWSANIYQKINNYYTKRIKNVISPSEWLLNFHLKKGFFARAKKIVAANPLQIRQQNRSVNSSVTNFKILYVGQLEAHKGILFLLAVWAELRKNVDEKVFLEIIGDGSLKAKVEILAAQDKNIIITGRLSQTEVLEKMSQSSLLIMPSFCYENYPTVIIEAISQNLPVIASDLGGIPEIIKTTGGFLFEPANQQSLLSKLEAIIKNPQLLEEVKNKYNEVDFVRHPVADYINDLLKTVS